jgi:cytochrome c-type biogenesis protein CcmF
MFDAGQQGTMRNPDIAAGFVQDFYISPISIQQDENHASHESDTYTIEKGGSVTVGAAKATFVKFDMGEHGQESMTAGGQMAVGSVLEVSDGRNTETIVPAIIYANDGTQQFRTSSSRVLNASIDLVAMNVGMGGEKSSVTIGVRRDSHDHHHHSPEALIVEASIKPFISLVWTGTVLMFAGFILAILKRVSS